MKSTGYIFLTLLISVLWMAGDVSTTGTTPDTREEAKCEEDKGKLMTGILIVLLVPTLLNVGSTVLLVFLAIHARKLKGLEHSTFRCSTWLLKTVVQVSIPEKALKHIKESVGQDATEALTSRLGINVHHQEKINI